MDQLIEIIENYAEIDGEITAATEFKKDLGLASFDTICMIDEIRDTMGVELETNDFVTYKTVGEMADYIAGKM